MAQQFPADAHATFADGAMTLTDAAGDVLFAVDLHWLAEKLKRAENCNAKERAAAGIAITQLLAPQE